ncbi:MAG TPA: glycosyltransferase family 2 protein [Gemmatimonadales bacterium]|jgi:glycosyltransferase involved in cell wall biosynthesis|nr:glycosyltransferase family 2 protein [Gemmatimonadales bacterium]
MATEMRPQAAISPPDPARTDAAPDADRTAAWPFSVSVIVPAFNEEATIAGVVEAVARRVPRAEIVVVDDASQDQTAARAAAAGARVIRRPYNLGNGAGVKTGIRAASGDVVVIVDGDGQHDPADIPRLLAHLGSYDMVIGARNRAGQQNFGRWLGNTLLNRLGSYLVGAEMRDLTSGFRAMRRDVITQFLHLLPNRFSWSTTSALAFVKAGYHVRFEPIAMRKRMGGQSGQVLLPNGVRFTLIILRIATLFSPLRIFFPIFVALELLAAAAYGWSVARGGPWLHLPPSTVMFFLGGIVLFLFGLISEQIASLRFRGPEG